MENGDWTYTMDDVMPNKLSGTYISHLMITNHSYDNFMIRETKLRDRDLQKWRTISPENQTKKKKW